MWIVSKWRGKKKREKDLVEFREFTAKSELCMVSAGENPGVIVFRFVGQANTDDVVEPLTKLSVVALLTPEQASTIAADLTEEVWYDSLRGIDGAELETMGLIADDDEDDEIGDDDEEEEVADSE